MNKRRIARRTVCSLLVAALAMGTATPAGADPQATIPISCDRPNTGITAGLFVNLNNEIPDPINSDSVMQVVDVERPVSGAATRVELNLPFPDMAGGFPPNDFGVTYGTFYIKSVELTVPIPAGYSVATVNPTESPDKNYVTATRSGSNLVVRVQSAVSGSRIRINTEVASPVAEVETSSGVWTPVVMPTIVINPTVTAAAGSTITWRPPSSSNVVVKWNRDFGFLIGQINWNDLSMPCAPQNPNQVVATTTVASPALAVTTTADETAVTAGSAVHLHVTATNTGDVPLTGVVITDANAPGCAGSPGNLAVGAHVTLDCTVATSAANVPTFSNTAGADSNETAPVTSNTVNVTVDPAGPTGISGTVTETGGGTPIGGALLAFLRTSNFSIAGGAVADGSGGYSANLPAGSYYVYRVDPSGRHQAGFHGPPTTVNVTPGTMVDVDPTMTSTRGSIGGTITEEGTGTPVSGAWALALDGVSGRPETVATANASGQFSIDDLPAGNHLVVYLDPSGAHAAEYYLNAPDTARATAVAVAGAATTTANGTPAAQTPVGTGASINGAVTETGTNAALANVAVIALRATDFRFASAAITDASGAYALDVAPGSYKLVFLDRSGGHHMEWYDNQPYTGIATATSVVAPGTASAALDRNAGTMTGRVTDDPAGTPLSGAWVVALSPNGSILGGAVTDGAGNYSIAGLLAGNYRATFVDPNGGRAQEYWNNASTFGGATPITIAGGAATTIDAALRLP